MAGLFWSCGCRECPVQTPAGKPSLRCPSTVPPPSLRRPSLLPLAPPSAALYYLPSEVTYISFSLFLPFSLSLSHARLITSVFVGRVRTCVPPFQGQGYDLSLTLPPPPPPPPHVHTPPRPARPTAMFPIPLPRLLARGFSSSAAPLATFNQVIRGARHAQPARKPVSPAMSTSRTPCMKAVCLKVTIMSPKKPNSADRKIARVRLSNDKVVTAYIPGEGAVSPVVLCCVVVEETAVC